jgi:pyrimidine-nucleoside phosphorylase
VALIADMNQPLGHAVGNALEVREAIETLRGGGPADFWGHCQEGAGQMLLLAGKADSLDEAKALLDVVREDGRALAKFRAMVAAQGGDASVVDEPDKLPHAEYVEPVLAWRGGYIAGINARPIGWSCVGLGGGRQVKDDQINHSVGMVIPVKVGQRLAEGDLVGTIHANDRDGFLQARGALWGAITWSDEPVEPLPLFYETVT